MQWTGKTRQFKEMKIKNNQNRVYILHTIATPEVVKSIIYIAFFEVQLYLFFHHIAFSFPFRL